MTKLNHTTMNIKVNSLSAKRERSETFKAYTQIVQCLIGMKL